ncbi:hypothetical protein [Methylomagnum sp.]
MTVVPGASTEAPGQHDTPERGKIARDGWDAQGNRRRDCAKQEALLDMGWRFLVVRECELRDIPNLVDKLRMFLAEDT